MKIKPNSNEKKNAKKNEKEIYLIIFNEIFVISRNSFIVIVM